MLLYHIYGDATRIQLTKEVSIQRLLSVKVEKLLSKMRILLSKLEIFRRRSGTCWELRDLFKPALIPNELCLFDLHLRWILRLSHEIYR